jgi:hypothetical protein
MVVAVGLTVVEPEADVDVKVPGVTATLVAPVVDQLSLLLEPEATLAALAVKAPITGLAAAVTVTVATVEPEVLVAVKV